MTAERMTTETHEEFQSWERLIRGACATVANEPVWLIEAILVVQHFSELTKSERNDLLRMADRIAAEFGLVSRPEPDGISLAIWLGRPENEHDPRKAIRLAYIMPSERSTRSSVEVGNE